MPWHITCLVSWEWQHIFRDSFHTDSRNICLWSACESVYSLLYYWIAMRPQQTLCHHTEEKKASETSWGVQSAHRHVNERTHKPWRQAFICGCKNKIHRQTSTSLFRFMWSRTCSSAMHTLKHAHTHLQTRFKASVSINTPTHTRIHLLVARPTLKSPLLSHSLSHASTCRETHTHTRLPLSS